MRIQRIRCKGCGRTTNILPSFLLARKSHSIGALKALIELFIINDTKDWKKHFDLSLDISTAYRWIRSLKEQALMALPEIRKTLLELKPEQSIGDVSEAHPMVFTSAEFFLKRFLKITEQLFAEAVRLTDGTMHQNSDLFCFLNHFLAYKMGQPLLAF